MATEKQIAANRRNARKSTGPRSHAGKRRVSHNAYRHGLTVSIGSSATFAKRIEQLARKIAGDGDGELILECARAAAEAELELARVRRAKVALIERVMAIGALDRAPLFGSPLKEVRFWAALLAGKTPKSIPAPVEPPAMPGQEPERSVEAIRRALPDLVKLDRYERRARTRRDQAIRELQKM